MTTVTGQVVYWVGPPVTGRAKAQYRNMHSISFDFVFLLTRISTTARLEKGSAYLIRLNSILTVVAENAIRIPRGAGIGLI